MYLHSNFPQIFSPKKIDFFMFLGSKKNFFEIFLKLSYATFQCGRYNVKKVLKKSFFAHEKLKKTLKKVAHNRPKPFYSTVQPRPTAHSPKLIFHIMKSRDQRSVLLSVVPSYTFYVANYMFFLTTYPPQVQT